MRKFKEVVEIYGGVDGSNKYTFLGHVNRVDFERKTKAMQLQRPNWKFVGYSRWLKNNTKLIPLTFCEAGPTGCAGAKPV